MALRKLIHHIKGSATHVLVKFVEDQETSIVLTKGIISPAIPSTKVSSVCTMTWSDNKEGYFISYKASDWPRVSDLGYRLLLATVVSLIQSLNERRVWATSLSLFTILFRHVWVDWLSRCQFQTPPTKWRTPMDSSCLRQKKQDPPTFEPLQFRQWRQAHWTGREGHVPAKLIPLIQLSGLWKFFEHGSRLVTNAFPLMVLALDFNSPSYSIKYTATHLIGHGKKQKIPSLGTKLT